ncbi:MAG: hypothetical protein V1794_16820 [Candidatus Glassbacteria bacterium]
MCQYCNLETLEPEAFDTFFTSAVNDGFRSMVCKHCAATFFTRPATLSGRQPEGLPAGVEEAEGNSLVLLSL